MEAAQTYELTRDADLQNLNTFWVPASARFLVTIHSVEGARAFRNDTRLGGFAYLVLGGGSNILFTKPYDGCIVLNRLKGKTKVDESTDHVYLKAYAGEDWHELVNYAVAHNWGGIENLALIPGTVGAAPIQNIGAYGVELKDTFYQLEALHLSSGDVVTFHHADCAFGYRNSIFKHALKGQYLILSVTLKLAKNPDPFTDYKGLREALEKEGITQPTVQNMRDIVTAIRKAKLPYPDEAGNAGSFFKNPYLTTAQFDDLQQKVPSIPSFPQPEGLIKVPAAWLIERAGMKGVREGPVGTHPNQPLVVVNYGGATGQQVYDFAMKVQEAVSQRFGIMLQPEVRIY